MTNHIQTLTTARKILKFILKILAKRVISRYQPIVIGITGSVGKTTTKEAIFNILSRKFWVWKTEGNYNNEFGTPFTVLGIQPKNFKRLGYKFSSIFNALWLTFGFIKPKYPKFLVLELAADRPGDIDYLVQIVRPVVGVVTAIGEVPVHVEFYASPESVAVEKSKLINALPAHNGLAVLNYDDQTVLDMAQKSKARITTFGFSDQADIWASDVTYFTAEEDETNGEPAHSAGGLSFKIHQGESFMPVRIKNLIGPHLVYAVLAGAAVGLHFGVNLIDISNASEDFESPVGRMKLVRGIKKSIIIDDTYNASPASTHAALDTLAKFADASMKFSSSKLKTIAVLGDMRELGKYEIEAHRSIGNLAAERTNILVTVGAAAKFIADSAANQMPTDKIFSFNTANEAKSKVKELIELGDIVLVKGSRAMKMERIVEEIAAR